MIQSISLLAFASTVAFAQPGVYSQRNNVGFGQKQQQAFPFPYDPSKQFNNFPAFPFPYYPSYPDYQLYPPTQGGGGGLMNNYGQRPIYDTKGSYGGSHDQYNVAFVQPQEQPFIPSLPNYPWETNYLFQYGYPFILKERLNGEDDKHDKQNSYNDKTHPTL